MRSFACSAATSSWASTCSAVKCSGLGTILPPQARSSATRNTSSSFLPAAAKRRCCERSMAPSSVRGRCLRTIAIRRMVATWSNSQRAAAKPRCGSSMPGWETQWESCGSRSLPPMPESSRSIPTRLRCWTRPASSFYSHRKKASP